jgi:hypothetical protein
MARTVIAVFPTMEHARSAVGTLIDEGLTDSEIWVVESSREREGGFSFTSSHPYNQHAGRKGTFADTEDHRHDRTAERQGSFADTEGHLHDRHQEPRGDFATGMADTEFSGEPTQDLSRIGIDPAEAPRWIDAIRHGRVLVAVQADAARLPQVNTIFDHHQRIPE